MKKSYWFLLFVLLVLLLPINKSFDIADYQRKEITVTLKGEGVVNQSIILPVNSTVEDLLEVVHLKEKADLSTLNNQMILKDNDLIVINQISQVELVSLNTSTIDQLTTLPNIGPAIAQRIIDYRNNNTFKKLEDIMNVKGIGQKTFDKIKDLICL